MSETVSNAEIEDVLSSIRRLVSEDIRPSAEVAEESAAPKPAQPADDRLVLTPNFRVSEPVANDNAATTDDHPANGFEEAAADDKPERLELRPEDAVEAEGDAATAVVEDEYTDQEAEDAAAEDSEEASDAVVDDASDDWEDNTTVTDDDADPEYEAVDWVDADQSDTDEGPHDTTEELSGLEQTIAELEAVIGDQEDEWEPDGSEPDVHTPKHMPGFSSYRKAATAPDDATPEPEQPEDTSSDHIFTHHETDPTADSVLDSEDADELLFESDAFLDEDALRDLVSEIVRQELQGSLGERITRNVRKLVRREIHRALAAKKLE